MVWFSDFKDIFQNLDKHPSIVAARKEGDIATAKAAAKAEAAAKAHAKDNQPSPPQPEPAKSNFKASNPATELRQIVK